MAEAGKRDVVHELDHALPAFAHVKLGTTLNDLITQFNLMVTQHNSLVTQHNALLAHVDTGNVAGIGNGNAAAYGVSTAAPPATTAALGTR